MALKITKDKKAKKSIKWFQFKSCLLEAQKKHKINLNNIENVCDLGCASGGLANAIYESNIFRNISNVEGWDLNSDAIKIAKEKYKHINFYNEDFLKMENKFDLVTLADVFEHIPDVYGFLRDLRTKSKYFLFYIPLELNLLNLLKGYKEMKRRYSSYGHFHFYSASTAVLLLETNGYEVISKRFAKDRTHNFFLNLTFGGYLASIPQYFIELFSPYLSSVLLGDHLVVLAKDKNE